MYIYIYIYTHTHIYIYIFTVFQRVNIKLIAIYFGIYHSSNAFISILGYSKICRKNFK
jgi:hypothetical protein